jgi:hypothetical protein
MAIENVMKHNCTIYKKYESVVTGPDEYGQPQNADIPKNYKCMFYRGRTGKTSGRTVNNGIEHNTSFLNAMVPNKASLIETNGEVCPFNFKLTTTQRGYAGTYSVEDIKLVEKQGMDLFFVLSLKKVSP